MWILCCFQNWCFIIRNKLRNCTWVREGKNMGSGSLSRLPAVPCSLHWMSPLINIGNRLEYAHYNLWGLGVGVPKGGSRRTDGFEKPQFVLSMTPSVIYRNFQFMAAIPCHCCSWMVSWRSITDYWVSNYSLIELFLFIMKQVMKNVTEFVIILDVNYTVVPWYQIIGMIKTYIVFIKNLAMHHNENIFFHRIWRWFLCSVTCKLLRSITSSAVSILIHQSGLFQAPITSVHKRTLWYICHRYVKTTSNTSANWHDTAMRWVLHFDTTYFHKHVISAGWVSAFTCMSPWKLFWKATVLRMNRFLQANVSVIMAWISFGALPCRGKLDDSSLLNVVEIACVPDMLPSLFPSWSG